MATHDYDIANGTGAAVRADINNALAAIQSNNSNASSPSTTVAYQWWADTNTGTLKMRNSSNNDWVELFQLDGTLTLEDGSASTPALAFRDDLNTGIFSSADNTLAISCDGSHIFTIDSSTATYECDVKFDGATSGRDILFDRSDNALEFADSAKAVFGSGGDLEIVHDGGTSIIKDTGTGNLQIESNGGEIQLKGGSDIMARFFVDGGISLFHDNTSKFEVISSGVFVDGNCGIGTSSATNQLHVYDGTTANDTPEIKVESFRPAIRFKDRSGSSVSAEIVGDNCMKFSVSTPVDDDTALTERMRLDSSGLLLLSTSSTFDSVSSAKLQISGGSDAGLAVTGDGTGAQSRISFFNPNGRVGFISTSGSATAYNTSSDYRLKQNATPISDGINRLKTLKPYRFNFKSDPTKTIDGFFAHEVTAVPEAVTGTKDEIDTDNNPVYQNIDQSKLVPLLVAAVQELIAKVAALEAA